jgi:hypothetical protein
LYDNQKVVAKVRTLWQVMQAVNELPDLSAIVGSEVLIVSHSKHSSLDHELKRIFPRNSNGLEECISPHVVLE